MRSVHCLQVHLWIPVAVVNYHRVCRGQVNAQASSPRAEQKYKLVSLLVHELIDLLLPYCHISGAINPTKRVLPESAIILHDIEQIGHLGEDEHPMPVLGIELGEEPIQDDHLA